MKDFGELKLLLQFEVDACYPVESNDAKCKDRLRELEKVPSTKLDGKIKVVLKGAYIPQSSIVELKTKKVRRFFKMATCLCPAIFVGNTASLRWALQKERRVYRNQTPYARRSRDYEVCLSGGI